MKLNKNTLIAGLFGLLLTFGTYGNSLQACTGIRLMASDKSAVYGRSMEWGTFDLHSRVAIIPRGYSFTGTTPDGSNGKKWKAKYGFVGLDMLGKDIFGDGMNEKGLAVGLFYHPGFSTFPSYEKDKADNTITAAEVVAFILTRYATLDEVRKGMNEVRVVPVVEESIGIPIDAHWMVTSADGKSIVIEYFKGEIKIFDNPLGVITNAPTFDWHMTNLRNYLSLSLVALPDQKVEDLNFKPLGGGSGMHGLPGDYTPPSRFVRAVAWTQTARPTETSAETVYEAFRILDNFNLPLGAAEGSGSPSMTDGMRSSTIWTTVWDLTQRVLYYHTQHNRRVRALDLKKLDFSKHSNEIRHLTLDHKKEQDIEDITPKP